MCAGVHPTAALSHPSWMCPPPTHGTGPVPRGGQGHVPMPTATSPSLVLKNWRGVGGETEALRPGVGCLPSATSPPVPALSPLPLPCPPLYPQGHHPLATQTLAPSPWWCKPESWTPRGLGGHREGGCRMQPPPPGSSALPGAGRRCWCHRVAMYNLQINTAGGGGPGGARMHACLPACVCRYIYIYLFYL